MYTTTSGGEIWLGWTAPDTFGVYSFDQISPGKARLINLRTGRSRTHYAGTFAEAALAPDSALAFITTSYDQRLSEGVYLVSAPGRKPARVAEGQWNRVVWRPDSAGLFYVSNGALYYSDLSSRRPGLVSRNVHAGMDGGITWVNGR